MGERFISLASRFDSDQKSSASRQHAAGNALRRAELWVKQHRRANRRERAHHVQLESDHLTVADAFRIDGIQGAPQAVAMIEGHHDKQAIRRATLL